MDESPIAGRGSHVQEGIVEAQLPSGLYRVDVDGDRRVTAHVGGGLERNFVRLLDRYAASHGDLVPVAPEPHSGPRRTKRAKEMLSNQARALLEYQGQSPWLVGERVVVELMPRDMTRGKIIRKA